MNTLKLAVLAWFRTRFMFGIVVPQYHAVHWCWNGWELIEWIECYPAGTHIIPAGLIGNMAELAYRPHATAN